MITKVIKPTPPQSMAKRINVILQDETVQTVSRAAKAGERSRFIDRAVQYYAAAHSPEALRERIRATALRDRDLGDAVARDWFAVDHAPWQTASTKERRANPPSRSVAKSTS